MLVALFIMPSCSDDDTIYEEPEIKVSESTVTFTKNKESKTLKITTNKDKWIATSSAEGNWLTLTQKDDELTIAVSENSDNHPRTTTVCVNALGAMAKVMVNQSEGDTFIAIDGEEDNIEVDAEGGFFEIPILTNADKIEVKNETEWAEARYLSGAAILKIKAKGNDWLNAREGEIKLVSDDCVKNIALNQKGLDLIRFPLISSKSSEKEMKAYEKAQGSKLVKEPQTGGWPPAKNRKWEWESDSWFMPKIKYIYNKPYEPYYQKASITINDERAKEVLLSDVFDEAAAKYGYKAEDKKVSEKEDAIVWQGSEEPVKMKVTIYPDGAILEFTLNPVQREDFPTFDKLPMQETLELITDRNTDKKGYTWDEVLEAEKNTDNIYNEENSAKDICAVFKCPKNAPYGQLFKQYNFYNAAVDNYLEDYYGHVKEVVAIYGEGTRACWYCKYDEHFKMTKEFKKLLEDNKYTVSELVDGGGSWLAVNEETNHKYTIIAGKDAKGKFVVQLMSSINVR